MGSTWIHYSGSAIHDAVSEILVLGSGIRWRPGFLYIGRDLSENSFKEGDVKGVCHLFRKIFFTHQLLNLNFVTFSDRASKFSTTFSFFFFFERERKAVFF